MRAKARKQGPRVLTEEQISRFKEWIEERRRNGIPTAYIEQLSCVPDAPPSPAALWRDQQGRERVLRAQDFIFAASGRPSP